MKKLILTLFVLTLILTGCGEKHGEYYKQVGPEVHEIIADAHETIQLHMDGKMDDYEAEARLNSLNDQLEEMDDLNGVEDSVKVDIQLAAVEVGSGDTAIDYLHNLEDYL